MGVFHTVDVLVVPPEIKNSVFEYFRSLHILNKRADIYLKTYIASDEMLKKLEEALNGKV